MVDSCFCVLFLFHCFGFVIDAFGIGFNVILVGVMTDELRSFLELNLPKVKEDFIQVLLKEQLPFLP
jgi:hypothetical protein